MRQMRTSAGREWRSSSRSLLLPLTLVLVAVLASGCSLVGRKSAQAEAAQATTATTAAGGGQPAAAPVIASSDHADLPGITLAINQLRRSDANTVTLIFTIANKGSKALNFDWTWGEAGFVEVGNALTFDMSGVYLVDTGGKKKYLVLRDTNKVCLCTTGILRSGTELKGVEAGQETTMYGKFPAPPASVSKLTVAVPHFPALDNVPLSS
jgi:hypothetical protein